MGIGWFRHWNYFSTASAILVLSFSGMAKADSPDPSSLAQSNVIASQSEVTFSNSHDGWKSTGLELSSGDEATIFASGAINMGLAIPIEPRMYLWARIGNEGHVFNLKTNSHSFKADRDGMLQLAIRPLGLYWDQRSGDFPDDFGGVPSYPLKASAETIVWAGTAKEDLAKLKGSDSGKYGQALENIAREKPLPAGFQYLWYLGQSNVFSPYSEAGRKGIVAHETDDAGIVKKPLDIELTSSTKLDFEWLYSKHRALGPETDPQFHDYMSIAIEFDNGQDITWIWSNHLKPGQSFTCPLPWWDQRETHIVLQQGDKGLGQWHRHSRRIAADYAMSVGGELPKRITGIWFINAGLFGGHQGTATFANAQISDGGDVTPVFASK